MKMMNYIIALIIILSVFIFWHFSKKLNLYSDNVFRRIIILDIIFICLDWYASFYIINDTVSNSFLSQIIQTFYLYIPLIYCFLSINYLLVGMVDENKHKKLSLYAIGLSVVQFLIVLFIFNTNIVVDGYGLFINQGTRIILTFLQSLYWIIIIIVLIWNPNINKWNLISALVSSFAFVFGIIAQYYYGTIGGVSIAASFSMIVYLIISENPLNNINKVYNCFKYNYLSTYLDRLFSLKRNCFICYLVFVEKNTSYNDNSEAIIKLIKKITKMYRSKRGYDLFISDDYKLVISCSNFKDFNKEMLKIKNFIDDYLLENNLTYRYKYMMIVAKSIDITSSGNKLINYFDIVIDELNETNEQNESIFYINENFIKDHDEEKNVIDMIISALNEDRVEIFVQPIYCIKKNAFISGEVLVRIRDKDGSIIPPYKFIPVAEKRGIIREIDERVFEKVCMFLADEEIKDLGIEYLDINLSVVECEMENYAEKIISTIEKYKISPSLINFEITESGLLKDIDILIANIRKLTSYGFGFSLDDFGNGESNVNYLVSMPVSNVKLDMEMIRAYFNNPNASKIVKSITNISHNMNMNVVAEGVEDNTQLDEMKRINVDYIQGYCFYKPMPISEYKSLLLQFETVDHTKA